MGALRRGESWGLLEGVVQEGRARSGRGGEGVRDCLNFLNLGQKRWLEKLENFLPFKSPQYIKLLFCIVYRKLTSIDGF